MRRKETPQKCCWGRCRSSLVGEQDGSGRALLRGAEAGPAARAGDVPPCWASTRVLGALRGDGGFPHPMTPGWSRPRLCRGCDSTHRPVTQNPLRLQETGSRLTPCAEGHLLGLPGPLSPCRWVTSSPRGAPAQPSCCGPATASPAPGEPLHLPVDRGHSVRTELFFPHLKGSTSPHF